MTDERIHTITQSVLAIICVIGGGLFVYTKPADSTAIVGVMSMIVGFYFRGAANAAIANAQAQNDALKDKEG